MPLFVTIDGSGRMVIPKSVRDRLRLRAGTRLRLEVLDGDLLLSTERGEPRVVEQDGFLAVDLGGRTGVNADHLDPRDERQRALVKYALKR